MSNEESLQDTIIKEFFYEHPIERVWGAISEETQISEWFISADFQPMVGYRYTFVHEDTKVTGTVLEVDPPTTLVYTWVVRGTTEITTVKWILESQGSGTKLRIEHSGFTNYSGDDFALTMFQSSVQGWDAVCNSLTEYLEK